VKDRVQKGSLARPPFATAASRPAAAPERRQPPVRAPRASSGHAFAGVAVEAGGGRPGSSPGVVQARWIERNGKRVAVPDDYQLVGKERDAPLPPRKWILRHGVPREMPFRHKLKPGEQDAQWVLRQGLIRPVPVVRPTAKELKKEKKNLKVVKRALADPENPSIQIGRGRDQENNGDEAPHLFADRIERIRRTVDELKSGKQGNKLISGIQSTGSDVKQWKPIDTKKVVDSKTFSQRWESGVRDLSKVLINTPSADASRYSASPLNTTPSQRLDAKPGGGSDSEVTFDDNYYNVLARLDPDIGPKEQFPGPKPVLRDNSDPSSARRNTDALPAGLRSLPPAVILGHELVHAYRNALGIAVKHEKPAAQASAVEEIEQKVRLLQEEFETIGLKRKKKRLHPTENNFRREYNKRIKGGSLLEAIPKRSDYGSSESGPGKKPRDQQTMLKSLPKEIRKQIKEDFRSPTKRALRASRR
jgi:hypothetical protein